MSGSAPPLYDLPPPEAPSSVQPGGFGLFVRMEQGWGRLRRWMLRRFRPKYVQKWLALRRGHCDKFTNDVIDPRDLKFIRNVCGYWFEPTDDTFRRRESLGIARYGFAELVGFTLILGLIAAVAMILAVRFHWAFLIASSLIVFLWLEVLWFFRDPERRIPDDPSEVVSPADGTVTHVEIVSDPDLGPQTLRISIFLSIFNVHVNRVPHMARIERVNYYKGSFLDARHPECDRRNEQLWVDFATDKYGRYRVKQISGAIARRIVCWVRLNEDVRTGVRYGMIKFGSRTELLVPMDRVDAPLVKVGDKVRGGVTVLVRWKAA